MWASFGSPYCAYYKEFFFKYKLFDVVQEPLYKIIEHRIYHHLYSYVKNFLSKSHIQKIPGGEDLKLPTRVSNTRAQPCSQTVLHRPGPAVSTPLGSLLETESLET